MVLEILKRRLCRRCLHRQRLLPGPQRAQNWPFSVEVLVHHRLSDHPYHLKMGVCCRRLLLRLAQVPFADVDPPIDPSDAVVVQLVALQLAQVHSTNH